ncbi:MAG: sphinganine C4-monooxygenase 1 [Bacteroidota bacterium]|nr:sphinganine C4-monooxygenase 1 [Bacteroidota bacterium]
MNALFLLMSIFVFSFLLAFGVSYLIVKKEDIKLKRLYTKRFTFAMFVYRCRLAIKNFILISILTTISLYVIGDSFFSFASISFWKFSFLFFVMVAVDDVWFYFIHRLMHINRFLYRKIHSVHHRAVPPIPMDYLFAHPIEAMGAAFGLIIGVIVLILISGNASIYVLAVYSFYRTIHELAVHSGFQIIPEKYLGWIGSSHHHFKHHKYHKGNYASAFTYLDKIFGTEIKEKSS